MKKGLFVTVTALSMGVFAAMFPVAGQKAQKRQKQKDDFSGWSDYMGSPESMQYSSLDQINKTNVQNLKVAWTFPTNDDQAYSFTPVVAHGVIYLMGEASSIIAVDARTGKQLWSHKTSLGRYRGLNFWESPDGSDQRIIYPDNSYLHELNAETGETIMTFGENGQVDLKAGLGRDENTIARIQSSSPGRVFENLIIMGSGTGERYDSPPGDIRAYDVTTGKLVWAFHTVPHKGEPGYETWPAGAAEQGGNGNVWGEMAVDPKRGILYAVTGVTGYNFFGGEREGKNLYGDCMLAINARTGKLIWYYQMIHHDIWDLDSPAGPKLFTVTHNGKKVDVVADATKTGFVFVFNRETGQPLWPIAEKPAPASDAPQEHSYPTQPIPAKPPAFAVQTFTVDDINPYMDPDEKDHWTEVVKEARNDGFIYTPPQLDKDSISMPGNHGGANWGMVAGDPTNGTLYVMSLNLPSILRLSSEPPRNNNLTPGQLGRQIVQARCTLCHGADLKGQPPTIPALADVTTRLGDDEIKQTVEEGRGSMPSFSDISDAELAGVITYLKDPSSVPQAPAPYAPTPPGQVRYYSGFGFFFPRNGTSIMRPPWVTLSAYDLNQGTLTWQIPLGDDPALAAEGIHNTGGGGVGATGGLTVTGGMVLVGSTKDHVLRAIDEKTGTVLWQDTLPLVSAGAPVVYQAGGKEYILVCDTTPPAGMGGGGGGRGPVQLPPGIERAYIAYSLPTNDAGQ